MHGDQIEVERSHRLLGEEGTLRLLLFRNVATMARFDEALAAAVAVAGRAVPVLDGVRRLQAKRGWDLVFEQTLSNTLGGFLRLGCHDGRTEVYSSAAIDNAISAGLVSKGAAWWRAGDQFGLAFASQGLSAPHRRYLAAGGSDFFIGDGALRCGRETIVAAAYTAALVRGLWLALDFQHIKNPACIRDRGPAQTLALRLQAEL